MKSFLQKIQLFVFLFAGLASVFAQQRMKVPKDILFYMEINGKQLDRKVNWEKFNPFLQEVAKKGKAKPNWTDYSKTGIKYDATQYHYALLNDSLQAYTAHFILDNPGKFQEFINSVKKEGLEITKKNKYSYVNLDNDVFVAWNGHHAVLKTINYNKPYDWEDDIDLDSARAIIDSVAAAATDSLYTGPQTDSVYVEKTFDYKEEIKYLKEDVKSLQENIKENNAEIARMQKDIKYLEKHHQYPAEKKGSTDKNYSEKETEPLLPPMPDDREEGDPEEDEMYQKELDSMNIEKFRMEKKLAEAAFDDYFNSAPELEVPGEMTAYRDGNSDVFVYLNYAGIMRNGVYGSMIRRYEFGQFFTNFYNSNYSYNLYFDKDKVRLVNNYRHNNPEIQKSIAAIYKGKKNKKLTALINDKSVGYYAINVDGSKYFDMLYTFLKSSGETDYQNEAELIMETMKIALDEKAIAKIAPGNGIFVLNELKSKTVNYTDFEYDDDFNEKEVQKTKEVVMPDFTFAFATENEGYWNRIFTLLTTNKKTSKNFSKNGNFYAFKDENSQGYFDQLFFTVKDGIVYVTSSPDNIRPKNQSETSKMWAKDSAKHPSSGRFDMQKLLSGLEKEFKSIPEKKTLNLIRRNVGEVYFKTEAKGNTIETEVHYQIRNSSENSLMYFFDLFDEIYKINESEKKTPVL